MKGLDLVFSCKSVPPSSPEQTCPQLLQKVFFLYVLEKMASSDEFREFGKHTFIQKNYEKKLAKMCKEMCKYSELSQTSSFSL